jgi:hypothetical protein
MSPGFGAATLQFALLFQLLLAPAPVHVRVTGPAAEAGSPGAANAMAIANSMTNNAPARAEEA